MTEWPSRPLREILDLFDSKRIPLSSAERATRHGPYPYYGAQGVIDHIDEYIFDGRFILIPEDGENLRSRKLPVAYFAEGQFWVNNHAHIVKAKGNVAVDRFVQSAIQAADISPYITGAAQPKLSQANLLKLQIPIPDVDAQRRVAVVLEALDDLIANNRRRVEVLEETARAIYREWFVHFRFPGHENASFVDSDLGPIPQGWRASTCGAELDYVGGGTPPKKEPAYWEDGTVDWFTPSDLTKTRLRYPTKSELRITEAGLAKSSAKLVPPATVMMTSRATLGVLAITTGSASTNQGFISVLPDGRWPAHFVREFLDASADGLAAIGTGATFKEITKGAFKSFPFLVPEQSVLDEYRAATADAELLVASLEQAGSRLVTLRDMLLPKLVTGQIDVSDLDLDGLGEG